MYRSIADVTIPTTASELARALDTPEKRNWYDTVAKCNELLNFAEANIEHEELPPHYDWLVNQRNDLERAERRAAPVETFTLSGEAQARIEHATGYEAVAVLILASANGIDCANARAIVATWGKVTPPRGSEEEGES